MLERILFQETEIKESNLTGFALLLCQDIESTPVEGTLAIATTKESIVTYQKKGFAVLGYELPGGQPLYGVEYVVLSLDEVDTEFLERVYRRHFNLPWDICETKRCYIREFQMEDLDALYDLYREPHMTDYMEDLYDYEEEAEYERAYIKNMYRYFGYGLWLVFKKEDDRLIGRAGIEHHKDSLELEYEMGYMIRSSLWNQGYATEVCLAILDYAKSIGIETLSCYIEKENLASIHLAEKIGFQYVEEKVKKDTTMLRYIIDFSR